jgi:serine/threonine-protein kinase
MGEPAGKRRRKGPRVAVGALPGASSDEQARVLYQQRLALFTKMLLVIFVFFMLFVVALYEIHPETAPARADIQTMIGFAGLTALVAIRSVFLRRHRTPTMDTLLTLDVVFVAVIGAIFGVSAYLSVDKPDNMYTTFIWNTFMIFGRTLYVPSSARRTFWLSAAGMLPFVIAAIGISVNFSDQLTLPPSAMIPGAILYAGTAVFVATTGSRVIYGLRKQVREAIQLGQYTLGEKIGEGGMGAVYKARHAMLRRPTAIKLLPPDRAGEEHLTRFEREVQVTAELTHPNTIAIFDYGRSPDGLFYYAMEYLDGIDLQRLVRSHGPQPAARVIHLLCQACGALEEAHGRGLIHRDIKPANLIVCQRGKIPDWIKVVDFGLVKDIEQASRQSSGNLAAGTPAYLSPEAIQKPAGVGPSGDLYALGAVAYFLLTGTTVFEADNVLEMCVHHVRTAPVPPSERTDNPIPRELEDVILRCLAKAPGDRPPGARALRELLEAVPLDEPWSEAAAAEWWADWRRPDDSDVLPADATTLLSPLTVDLTQRAVDRGPA